MAAVRDSKPQTSVADIRHGQVNDPVQSSVSRAGQNPRRHQQHTRNLAAIETTGQQPSTRRAPRTPASLRTVVNETLTGSYWSRAIRYQ